MWTFCALNSVSYTHLKELSIRQLSELISFVTQDNFLFNCSLKENIRLGNPNATDEEVYAAAKAACCDEFIARLEKGYDTPAGDAGRRLSGGEKQRIAIARAILKMCIRDRSNAMLIVLIVAPIIGGIIGAFIAKGLFQKHFVKAGIV